MSRFTLNAVKSAPAASRPRKITSATGLGLWSRRGRAIAGLDAAATVSAVLAMADPDYRWRSSQIITAPLQLDVRAPLWCGHRIYKESQGGAVGQSRTARPASTDSRSGLPVCRFRSSVRRTFRDGSVIDRAAKSAG